MKKQGSALGALTNIMGQPHGLAWITPEEERVLVERGGGRDKQGRQVYGPGGVPAFFDGNRGGNDNENSASSGVGSGVGGVGEMGNGGVGGHDGGRDRGGHPGMGGTSNRNGPSTSIGSGVNSTGQMGPSHGFGGNKDGHPGMSNNPRANLNAIGNLRNHSAKGWRGATGGAKRTHAMQSANAYNNFDNPLDSNSFVDRAITGAFSSMGMTPNPANADPADIGGFMAGMIPGVGWAFNTVQGLRRGNPVTTLGQLAGGPIGGLVGLGDKFGAFDGLDGTFSDPLGAGDAVADVGATEGYGKGADIGDAHDGGGNDDGGSWNNWGGGELANAIATATPEPVAPSTPTPDEALGDLSNIIFNPYGNDYATYGQRPAHLWFKKGKPKAKKA